MNIHSAHPRTYKHNHIHTSTHTHTLILSFSLSLLHTRIVQYTCLFLTLHSTLSFCLCFPTPPISKCCRDGRRYPRYLTTYLVKTTLHLPEGGLARAQRVRKRVLRCRSRLNSPSGASVWESVFLFSGRCRAECWCLRKRAFNCVFECASLQNTQLLRTDTQTSPWQFYKRWFFPQHPMCRDIFFSSAFRGHISHNLTPSRIVRGNFSIYGTFPRNVKWLTISHGVKMSNGMVSRGGCLGVDCLRWALSWGIRQTMGHFWEMHICVVYVYDMCVVDVYVCVVDVCGWCVLAEASPVSLSSLSQFAPLSLALFIISDHHHSHHSGSPSSSWRPMSFSPNILDVNNPLHRGRSREVDDPGECRASWWY